MCLAYSIKFCNMQLSRIENVSFEACEKSPCVQFMNDQPIAGRKTLPPLYDITYLVHRPRQIHLELIKFSV